jgi:ATPase family associated with various cellular activities (AAA)
MTRAQLPPLPRGIQMLTTDASQSLNRRMPIARAYTPSKCVTCSGKKFFLWRDPEGGPEPVLYDCPCDDQYLLFRWLLNSGIPLTYQRLGWSDYTYLSEAAMTEAAQYLEHRDAFINAGFGMVLWGSRGTGKTLLANLLLKEFTGDGVGCYSTTFADMVDAFAGGWHDPAQEAWFNRTLRNARVLYIDDVGREYSKDRFADAAKSDDQIRSAALADNRPGSMKETLLEAVVRHRTANSLPTFVSTNFTPDQISQGYGGHTMSLLSEKAVFVEVSGADRRNEMRRRETDFIAKSMVRPIVIERALG